jgi:hypothetical protein
MNKKHIIGDVAIDANEQRIEKKNFLFREKE